MKLFSIKLFSVKLLFVILSLTGTLSVFGAGIDPSYNPQLMRNIAPGYNNLAVQPDGKILVFGSYDQLTSFFFARLNPDGTTDGSFNCTVCQSFQASAAAVQPDGKILVGGISSVIRLNSDGSQDTSFVSGAFTGDVLQFVVQPDGKVLFRSVVGTPQRQYSIRRLNADGSIDAGFTVIAFLPGIFNYIVANDFILTSDGKILAGSNNSGTISNGFLSRYNSNGTTDPTFEAPTITVPGLGMATIQGLAEQPDGKYLVSGFFETVNGLSRKNIVRLFPAGNVDATFNPTVYSGTAGKIKLLANGQFITALAPFQLLDGHFVRYNSDGSLDNTYTQFTGFNNLTNWTVDSSGRVVFIAGFSGIGKIARLNADGTLEMTFNVAISAVGDVSAFALQPDGKAIVIGNFNSIGGVGREKAARLNADGSLDPTFNPGTGFDVAPTSIAVQTDGKILFAGSFSNYNGTGHPKVLRVNADGSLDAGFAPTTNSSILTFVPLADGKILIGGDFTLVNGSPQSGVARLNADGSLDSAFNPILSSPPIRSILVQTDGKIMIGGSFSGVNGFNRTNIARLNADGTLDSAFNAASVAPVFQLIQQPDGKYLVTTATSVFRRNNDGSADSGFQASTYNGTFRKIALQADGGVIVGGDFTTVNSTARSRITRLKSDGTLDLQFVPSGANGAVNALVAQTDGKILVGGSFKRIDNVARTGIARITTAVPTVGADFDYDGDGKSDISVFRASENKWYILQSSNFALIQTVFAIAGDVAAPGDYDGDGKTDVAVFRPSTGSWWYQSSINNAQVNVQWGQAGDIARPSDFDGDGKTDFIVYRPSNSVWYRYGSTGVTSILAFGIAEDKPLVGDFDGDGKADQAIFRPSTGDWWYAASSAGGQFRTSHWGAGGDVPVPADYDGDGKTDLAVFRPSTGGWYIYNSSNGSVTVQGFGLAEDKPIAGDYDGDGKADIAVYRPSSGTWYLLQTTAGFGAVQLGNATDLPTESSFIP